MNGILLIVLVLVVVGFVYSVWEYHRDWTRGGL